MLNTLETTPDDPILRLTSLFEADENPKKIDLGAGVYKDKLGNTPIMRAVAEASRRLLISETTKTYVGIAGWEQFNRYQAMLVLGKDNPILSSGRLALAQTPGGSGALRVISDLIKKAIAPNGTIWIGRPTYANHRPILIKAGLNVAEHPYFNTASNKLDFTAMMETLNKEAKKGDIVVIHGCCHNPSGVDLDLNQWIALSDLFTSKAFYPL